MVNLYSSLLLSIEAKISSIACKESYYDCIGKKTTELHSQRLTLVSVWRMFTEGATLTPGDLNIIDCWYIQHFGTKQVIKQTVATVAGVPVSPDPPVPPEPPTPSPNYIDVICTNTPFTSTIEYSPGLFYDLYLETCNENTDRPVFVGLHPGGSDRTSYKAYPKDYAQRGYYGVSADYGETTPYTGARQIIAVINMLLLMNYLKINSSTLGIDSNNIFIGGTSAGAVTTYQFMLIASALNSGSPATVAAAQALLSTASNYSLLSGKDLSCVPKASFTQAGAASTTFTSFIGTYNKINKFYNGTLDCTVPYSNAQCGLSGALENYNSMHTLANLSTFTPYNGDGHSIDSHHDQILLGGGSQVVGLANSTYGSNTFTLDIGIITAFAALIT
jgi:acetyl esterase/lipase